MHEEHGSTENHHTLGRYEFRLTGHLDDRWADRFAGLTITRQATGETLLTIPVVDEAALHGVLRTVRDLALPLISVIQVETHSGEQTGSQRGHGSPSFEHGDTHMNTRNLIRWAGLAAMGAGILYIAIQPIHPLDVLASVTSPRWAIVHAVSIVMDCLALLGLTGLYARQVEKSGWLGLAGYLLFSLFWALNVGLHFIEAFISPLLATAAPQVVEGLLGLATGHATALNLGALATIPPLGLVAYLPGGLLFASATFRAGILPRWAAGLLAVGVALPLLGALLQVQHPYDRIFAVPVGVALAWLGYALWAERRAPAADPVPGRGIPQLGPTTAV